MMKLTPRTTVRELFLKACEDKNLDMVSTILSYGADVNWKGRHFGWSGLHWAVNNNCTQLLEELLETGNIDVNTTDAEQETPLMRACQLGQEEMVRSLCLADGVNLNLRDNRGKTALLHAVAEGLTGCVEIFRETDGIDWNARDEDGESALSVAVDQGSAEILKIILSVPAPYLELGFTDINGRNIVQIAIEAAAGTDGMNEVDDEAVNDKPKEPEESVVKDAVEKDGENVGDMLAVGESLMDVKEELAETEPGEVFKLKQEVVGGGVEKSVDEMDVEDGSDFLACLRMLSEDKRVDMNIKNSNGNTPLMYCLKTGRVEMARLLLQDPRVDLDTTDKEGQYPENIARKRNLRKILAVMWRGERYENDGVECPVCQLSGM